MRQIHSQYWHDDQVQVLIQSLQRKQLHYDNDNLVLNISYCSVAHPSLSLLVQLMSAQSPIVKLRMRDIKFQSTSGIDSFHIGLVAKYSLQGKRIE